MVHHDANGHFDWLISGHQSVDPLTEIISILPGKCKRFMFVHPVTLVWLFLSLLAWFSYSKAFNFALACNWPISANRDALGHIKHASSNRNWWFLKILNKQLNQKLFLLSDNNSCGLIFIKSIVYF